MHERIIGNFSNIQLKKGVCEYFSLALISVSNEGVIVTRLIVDRSSQLQATFQAVTLPFFIFRDQSWIFLLGEVEFLRCIVINSKSVRRVLLVC